MTTPDGRIRASLYPIRYPKVTKKRQDFLPIGLATTSRLQSIDAFHPNELRFRGLR